MERSLHSLISNDAHTVIVHRICERIGVRYLLGNVAVAEAVRLVIWDLDDTLWHGTLTEGGITEFVEHHHDVVRALARRGIISSICSKNDFQTVKAILTEKSLWDYFVFPSIDWSPKGHRIRQIIAHCQLRPEAVLFIDDNPSNRGEAVAAVSGLRVADETIIAKMLGNPVFTGKDDGALERLAQYKLLESKAVERQSHSDVTVFLRESSIEVETDFDIVPYIDRVIELINRTNQLNFTKKRLPTDMDEARAELQRQLDVSYGRRAAVVRVKDKFGDYGIVGFWMLDGVWGKPYLIHFVFSCRTLGMGIEQWVYARLGRPALSIVGQVIATLDADSDWINQEVTTHEAVRRGWAAHAVRLRGGCELEVVKHYFSFDTPSVSSEFVEQSGLLTLWPSHSSLLHPPAAIFREAGFEALRAIGLNADDYRTRFLAPCTEPTCLVYSLSADFEVPLYRHKTLGFSVPLQIFGLNLAAPVSAEQVASYAERTKLTEAQTRELTAIVAALHADYEVVLPNQIDFKPIYQAAFDAVPANARLVVLLPPTYAPRGKGNIVQLDRQKALNTLLRSLAEGRSNVALVEVAACIESPAQMRDNSHLHYDRGVYHRIAERIRAAYSRKNL